MGKLVVLAILAGGWWAWQNGLVPTPRVLAAPSPAFETYTRFSEYLAHDMYGKARKLAAKGAVRAVQVRELRGRRNTRLGIGASQLTKDTLQLAQLGDVTGVFHEALSETPASDGRSVAIRAVQRVCRDRSGCRETEHEVEVCLSDGDWKVCSFRE